jgi:hypothetical protein
MDLIHHMVTRMCFVAFNFLTYLPLLLLIIGLIYGTFYLYYRNKIKLKGILTIHNMFVVLFKFEYYPRDPKTKTMLDEKVQDFLFKKTLCCHHNVLRGNKVPVNT